MEEGRWSFTFFRSFFEAAQAIDDKEARADFYDAVCQYAITGSVPEDISPIAKALFILAKPNLDVSRKKAEAGSRGGRSAKQDETEVEADEKQDESISKANEKQTESKPKAEEKQNESKEEANRKQTASDKRIENREERIENGEDNLTFSDENVCRTKDVRRVQEAWNELGLQKITKILPDTSRGKMLKRRVLEYGVDKVLEAIQQIRGSPFLKGNNDKGWVITFDWFIRPNNFPKVLEGNYTKSITEGGAESAKNEKFGAFEVPTQNDFERMKDMLNDLKGGQNYEN